MKNLIVFLTTIFVFSGSANAFDQWCAQSPEVNYRATLAVDNLEFLEEEVRYFNSYRRRIINQIQGVRGFLNNLINITDSNHNDCYNIQSHFYRVDWRVKELTRLMNRRLLRNPNSPVQLTWDTFVRSFIELESLVINLDAGYNYRRGPIYRRYFPTYRRYFPVFRTNRRIRPFNRRRNARLNRIERRQRRLERRERRLERRERRLNRRNQRRNPNRNLNRNPNRNPNRNVNSNSNRNPNRNPRTNRSSRRDRRS